MNATVLPTGGSFSLPHSYEAEQALLGAILTNGAVYDKVADFLLPEHFADALHGRIYEAAGILVNQGKRPDVLKMEEHFETTGTWPPNCPQSPRQYLGTLVRCTATILGAEDYGHFILDLYQRRAAMIEMEAMSGRFATCDVDSSAVALIEETEQRLADIVKASEGGSAAVTVTEAADEALVQIEAAMKRGGALTGCTTGLIDLDDRLGGLHKCDLIVIAGRPGMGKTALATNILRAVASHHDDPSGKGGPAYFASLEMGRDEVAMRLMAEMTGIGTDRQRRGRLNAEEFESLMEARHKLSALPIMIDATHSMGVQAIRSRARRYARRMGRLGVIVVDYLQLMVGGRAENRVQEVSKITRDLKGLAKELEVPVIALSQLSREVEKREDKRPQLADLRESGSIEQDADAVVFIYRDEYYLERQRPEDGDDKFNEWVEKMDRVRGKAELIVAKNRHGPAGVTVFAHWNGAAGRFGNLVH